MGWLGQMVGTPYGGVVGWFHAGVRPWGLSALLLAVGSPVLWVLLGCGICVWVVFLGLVAGWI